MNIAHASVVHASEKAAAAAAAERKKIVRVYSIPKPISPKQGEYSDTRAQKHTKSKKDDKENAKQKPKTFHMKKINDGKRNGGRGWCVEKSDEHN